MDFLENRQKIVEILDNISACPNPFHYFAYYKSEHPPALPMDRFSYCYWVEERTTEW